MAINRCKKAHKYTICICAFEYFSCARMYGNAAKKKCQKIAMGVQNLR